MDGKEFSRLTKSKGLHEIRFSPSKEFFLDTHSTTDRPPRTELSHADGTLVQTLSEANIESLLKELKWKPLEEFVVKAADGKTDLYGALYKPHDFNPRRKYPVIEIIYGGAQFSEVQHGFTHRHFGIMEFHGGHAQALAQLGFIVFMVDGRGTPDRSKEFQDIAHNNMDRHVIPDHMAALRQLAEKRPYMDLNRVGILGHSWGGTLTVRALLQASDVYKVGVAVAGSQGIALGRGPYINLAKNDEAFEDTSKERLAANLRGNLLFIIGTSDLNTQFGSVMKMVEALIQAGKPHDLIILPEQSHWFTGASRTYALEGIRRYFQEHLKP